MLVCHSGLSGKVTDLESTLTGIRTHRFAPQFIAGVATQGQRAGLDQQIKSLLDGFFIRPVSLDRLEEVLRTGRFQTTQTDEQGDLAPTNSQKRNNSLSILIAEDNAVNQRVAARMLEKLGCHVDIVENGIEAVAAIKEKDYTLVLMDVQMPKMDGYEATRIIRGELAERVNKVPIIALTANAMEEDRQHCLAAGMNDFLRKPMKREELQRVITRWQNLLEKPHSFPT